MNQSDFISIVVPVYNCEKYIGKCIKSIQKQTFQNWNLILVDDGSKDRSGKICDRFAAEDSRISVVHQENGGTLQARLTGIAHTCGEFIAFVDADDLVEPEMFQKLINTQVQYSADIVCCGYKTLSRRGWIKRKHFQKNNSDTISTGKNEAVRMAASIAHITLWGKLYRRNLFVKAKEILETIPNVFWGEDSLINTAVFHEADKIVLTHDELYDYRFGGGSSSLSEKTMYDLTETYKWRKSYLLSVGADLKYHRANLAKILDDVIYYAYNNKTILSRDLICSELAVVIADIEDICPDYWRKNAYDLNISMTDKEFKNIYRESPLVVIKQMLLRIL